MTFGVEVGTMQKSDKKVTKEMVSMGLMPPINRCVACGCKAVRISARDHFNINMTSASCTRAPLFCSCQVTCSSPGHAVATLTDVHAPQHA
eukprot:360012-Amphidinium_carterae.1